MIFLRLAVLVLLLWAIPARAQLHVSTGGNDNNNCASTSTPCLTIQGAADKVAYATLIDISVAPGIYSAGANVYYWRGLNIHGPLSNGACTDPTQVIIDLPSSTVAFQVQDNVILGVSCMTIRGASGASAVSAFAVRQGAILDFLNMRFGALPGGSIVSLSDRGMASCAGNVWIDGSLVVAGNVYNSTLNWACFTTIAAGLGMTHFFSGAGWAIINAQNAVFTVTGGGAMTGRQWWLEAAGLYRSSAGYHVPGATAGTADSLSFVK